MLISTDAFLTDLSQILQCEAFELHAKNREGQADFYIPYMMNDAIECFFILRDCRMTGEFLPDSKEVITAEQIKEDAKEGILFRQGTANVFVLWFSYIEKHLTCYPYHTIGHFWQPKQEQWRQLVYIIGTIYDKYEYLGESVCTPQEMALLPLMEFAPFRKWSPIHTSLLDNYEDTTDGLHLMQELACEVSDKWLSFLLNIYKLLPMRWMAKLLAQYLTLARSQPLYQAIYQRVAAASQVYPPRTYAPEQQEFICNQRALTEKLLKQYGFSGSYPQFFKGDWQIVVMEEHPFTILESEDFSFRIQYMVSQSSRRGLNAGFFRGIGNQGFICKNMEELEQIFKNMGK